MLPGQLRQRGIGGGSGTQVQRTKKKGDVQHLEGLKRRLNGKRKMKTTQRGEKKSHSTGKINLPKEERVKKPPRLYKRAEAQRIGKLPN